MSYGPEEYRALELHIHTWLETNSSDVTTNLRNVTNEWKLIRNGSPGSGDIKRSVNTALQNAEDLVVHFERLRNYLEEFYRVQGGKAVGEKGKGKYERNKDEEKDGKEDEYFSHHGQCY